MSVSEFEFIQQIRANTPNHPRVMLGPGDDCAVLTPSTQPLLVTTDVLTEGVDFILSECGPRAVGRKAMAANLSDIAAMGGRPVAAVVGVVFGAETSPPRPPSPSGEGVVQYPYLPDSFAKRQESSQLEHHSLPREMGDGGVRFPVTSGGDVFSQLHLGLREVADAFGCPIIGGDTNSWAGGLVVSVTVLGEPIREPVLRSGAKPGDWIFSTGPHGGSILGRHLSPVPRLTEAEALVTRFPIHAMIDVSDGLAADLNHICEESNCGAVLVADSIPIHPDAVELAKRTGKTPLRHALGDGEDFELVFTVSAEDGAMLLANPPVPVWKIGEVVSEPGLWLIRDGVKEVLPPMGWQHAL